MLVKNKLLLAAAFLIGVLVASATAESEKVVEPLVGFVGPEESVTEDQGNIIVVTAKYIGRSYALNRMLCGYKFYALFFIKFKKGFAS